MNAHGGRRRLGARRIEGGRRRLGARRVKVDAALPGWELVEEGLAHLTRGVESIPALLVSIGAPRLRRLGFIVPDPFPSPEHRLYARLALFDSDSAHSRYNALIRRLVSFEQAMEAGAG